MKCFEKFVARRITRQQDQQQKPSGQHGAMPHESGERVILNVWLLNAPHN